MSAFTLTALLSILGLLAASMVWILILRRRLAQEKCARIRSEKTLELNKSSVSLAREVLNSAETKRRPHNKLPAYLSPIYPSLDAPPAPEPHEAWKKTVFAYDHQPGNLRLSREDVAILDALRSPGSLQDLALICPAFSKAFSERLDRLHKSNLLERLDEKRYVTSHEGHVQGLMTVPEAVVFSHVSKKPSKSMTLVRSAGDGQGSGSEIREALDSLCERGYMERDGNHHRMVPMPSSPPVAQ